MPNGRWHWAGCPQSISAFETCVKGAFSQFKINDAVFANKQFTFQYRQTSLDFVFDMNVLFLHVVRDSGGNFVTYNWNTRWLMRILSCTDQAIYLTIHSSTVEKADAM